ncbi:hypothetical protein AKJ09_00598 [Labilithrix luteola]|uniref:BNR repeat domain protein n=1 Tax=Labilithrix luteola TaxID=1391654 RepID=A0A0K1PLE0_9BACT|nr:hypothetical protein [Labilithrix luteola]AKU93934.1 hypothetical protein AKJ09_00598 [Labilithrix luteola]
MTRIRGLFLVSSSLAAVVGTLVACSSSDEPRTAFGGDDTADAGTPRPDASLPPTSDAQADAKPDVTEPPIVRPPFESADVPVTCASEPCAVQLVAGDQHFCARLSDGTVRCWGDNSGGQLGTTATTVIAPQTVLNVATAKQISAAEYATCVVLADNTAQCWGRNRQGQLGLRETPGLSDYTNHTAGPVVTTDLFERIDVGSRTVCGVTTTGTLDCWGYNDQQQTTRSDAGTVAGPARADMKTFNVVRTASTQTSVLGILDDGHLVSWGKVSGRISSITPNPVPALIDNIEKVTSIATGTAHACAIADGELYCWGAGSKGVLGTGLPNDEKLPALATIENTPKLELYPQQVAASTNATCARITDGTIQCAGDDSYGTQGTGEKAVTSTAKLTKVAAYTGDAVQVAVSLYTVCALDKNGTIQCWGGNIYGELGQGVKDYDRHPTAVTVTF